MFTQESSHGSLTQLSWEHQNQRSSTRDSEINMIDGSQRQTFCLKRLNHQERPQRNKKLIDEMPPTRRQFGAKSTCSA